MSNQTALIKLDQLISNFQSRSISSFSNSREEKEREEIKQDCDSLNEKNLSFMTATNLVEYCDDYFDNYIPNGRFISGTFDTDNDWIIVYQAFNKNIAEYAVKHQDFLGNQRFYSKTRMTWIKPNFLWMMYRANWAQNDYHQANILAIFLKLSGDGFINLVKNSNKNKGDKNRVNLQWDPHHLPNGDKVVNKRAIQLGVKGTFNTKCFHSNIIKIEDITDFVKEQYDKRMNNEPFLVPKEKTLCIQDVKGDNNLEESDINRIKLGKEWRQTDNSQTRKNGKKARKRANIDVDGD